RLLRIHRLLKDSFPPRGFLSNDPLRIAQFRFVAAFRFRMRDDAAEIQIDDQGRVAARTRNFEFRLQPCHYCFPFDARAPRPGGGSRLMTTAVPSGCLAVSCRSLITAL